MPRVLKTSCPQGHAYDEENTYVSPKGIRGCIACRRESKRKFIERKTGNLPTPIPPYEDRFRERMQPTSTGCILWTGHLNWNGYGRVTYKGRLAGAHRVAYEIFKGPIPDGLQLDHLCRVRNCVNPEHLEPVTPSENTLRGYRARAEYKTSGGGE
jgi:hypothetical protein